ncbi:MAG TPA: DoxX family protein [Casimicrobiaceae bacterium]|jgi:putative oxidoreductase|nr:DoxX family protein [Casimicrobiaceae bacterium]
MNGTTTPSPVGRLAALYCLAARLLAKLEPLLLLGFRLYIARVFFLSGLTKIRDWSSTVALFTDEYHVPLLSPPIAAALGAATELSMPVLLVLGLGSRFAAGVLFVFNIVAVVSYHETLTQTGGIGDHILWGTMLAVLTICGPGKIALDTLLEKRFAPRS